MFSIDATVYPCIDFSQRLFFTDCLARKMMINIHPIKVIEYLFLYIVS